MTEGVFLTAGTFVIFHKDDLRANAQKNRANRGHSLKPNPPSFSVYDKGLMSL